MMQFMVSVKISSVKEQISDKMQNLSLFFITVIYFHTVKFLNLLKCTWLSTHLSCLNRFLGVRDTVSTSYMGHYLAYCTSSGCHDDERGAVGGMRIGRGNQSTQRKPAPVPFCPPQIPYDLTWDWTQPAVVGSRQLTA
jgi:hypothetical protein